MGIKISYRTQIEVSEEDIKKAISTYFYIKNVTPSRFIDYCYRYHSRCREIILQFYIEYRRMGFNYYDNVPDVDKCYGILFSK